MNNFEEHIRSQRPWMDVEEPNLDAVWDGIEAALPEEQSTSGSPKLRWLRGVAAAVALVLAGTLAHHFTRSDVELASEESLLPATYLNEENILQTSVDNLLAEIEAEQDSATDLSFLESELLEIERLDAELRETLSTTRDQEKVLQRLLDHYQKKIRILQHMLREIKKQKQLQQRIHRDYV